MRAKFIYEKFTEDSDPVSDLGIGGVLINDYFVKRRKKLEGDIEKLKDTSQRNWELHLRKILIGKTITADMEQMAAWSKDMKQQIRKREFGKFTIKVADIAVQGLEHEYDNYLVIAGEDHILYKLSMTKKIYISDK